MLRILGKIVGRIIIRSGFGIERTSTDHYYSLDSIMAVLDPVLKKTKSVYTVGATPMFRFMDMELLPRYRIHHVSGQKQPSADFDQLVMQKKKYMVRISSPGNELSILDGLKAYLDQADIIWISSSFYHINENPAYFFRLLNFLKGNGYGYLRPLAGTQESYWQPVQDYAGISIIACRNIG